MDELETLTYEVTGRIARITLNRPERGNGITLEMPRELADCVERANLDPEVHVIALAGNGSGFCGGYDPAEFAAGAAEAKGGAGTPPPDPAAPAANHAPTRVSGPGPDYQTMFRTRRRRTRPSAA